MAKLEITGGQATVGAVGRAMRYPRAYPAATAAHFAEFAFHLLQKGRPLATGTLLAGFSNHGNELAGETPEARVEAAEAVLMADDRVDYSDELGGWILTPGDEA